MDGILGQVGSRQLVPINRNILVWTVYWDRLVPGSLSRLTEISQYGRYIGMCWFLEICPIKRSLLYLVVYFFKFIYEYFVVVRHTRLY